jgi:hypothetical protein
VEAGLDGVRKAAPTQPARTNEKTTGIAKMNLHATKAEAIEAQEERGDQWPNVTRLDPGDRRELHRSTACSK